MRYRYSGYVDPGEACLSADIDSQAITLTRVTQAAQKLQVLNDVRSQSADRLSMINLWSQQFFG